MPNKIIYIIITNENENYSVFSHAYKSKEMVLAAIKIQKKLFPNCEYSLFPVELVDEVVN